MSIYVYFLSKCSKNKPQGIHFEGCYMSIYVYFLSKCSKNKPQGRYPKITHFVECIFYFFLFDSSVSRFCSTIQSLLSKGG